MKKKAARKLESFLHFLTATLLLIKGIDEIVRKLYFPGSIIIGLALTVLVINFFWRFLKITPKQARTVCWYIETPALIVTSYMLHLEKKEFMPHIFLLAAVIYPVMGFVSSKKFKKMRKAAKKKRKMQNL
ncbi:hypothetical protein GCM10007424_14470 [Flavobacterium suaedae]|uniref:Uncharacterized protein n=1 Tax=Flavobacterium suaedae TaxID=1767027 RepID=A0ABQ1JSF0_9FLAO|nr:hypothetical protein [Flavobacterium suaedae]GGB75640.1 hypothetical protein GCM10007424_14470 [Flavobacterium suaedae]